MPQYNTSLFYMYVLNGRQRLDAVVVVSSRVDKIDGAVVWLFIVAAAACRKLDTRQCCVFTGYFSVRIDVRRFVGSYSSSRYFDISAPVGVSLFRGSKYFVTPALWHASATESRTSTSVSYGYFATRAVAPSLCCERLPFHTCSGVQTFKVRTGQVRTFCEENSLQAYVIFWHTTDFSIVSRVVHGLGRVGSRFFSFWWVGFGWVHYSKSTKTFEGLF